MPSCFTAHQSRSAGITACTTAGLRERSRNALFCAPVLGQSAIFWTMAAVQTRSAKQDQADNSKTNRLFFETMAPLPLTGATATTIAARSDGFMGVPIKPLTTSAARQENQAMTCSTSSNKRKPNRATSANKDGKIVILRTTPTTASFLKESRINRQGGTHVLTSRAFLHACRGLVGSVQC